MSFLKDLLFFASPIGSTIGAELPKDTLPGTTIVQDTGLGADTDEQTRALTPFEQLAAPSIDFLFWGALGVAGFVGYKMIKNRKHGGRGRRRRNPAKRRSGKSGDRGRWIRQYQAQGWTLKAATAQVNREIRSGGRYGFGPYGER